MSFVDRYQLTQNDTLRTKVRMAGVKAANAILGDLQRAEEYAFCRLVIKEPMSTYWLDQLMFSVVTNEVINENSPDNDVEFQVNAVFGNHALAFTQTA